MNELLKAMYDTFYKPITAKEQNKEIDECHQQLIAALDKPERRLVLRIIDAKDHIIEDSTMDGFFFGFRMGCQLAIELKMNEKAYSSDCRKSVLNTPSSFPSKND